MPILNTFQRRMLLNYIIGSFIAVFGVGSIFIFYTLTLSTQEITALLIVMGLSVMSMLTCEFIVFQKHIRPIKTIIQKSSPTITELEKGYIRAHYQTVKPLISHITARTKELYGRHFSIDESYFLSIRKKLLVTSVFTAVFPIALFILASQIRLAENQTDILQNYWNWASMILIVILAISLSGALLIYKSIEEPIDALRDGINQVRNGELEYMENTYSDEFSQLVKGFNHMVSGIQDRDQRNEQLLESFFTVFAATLDARDPYTAGHSQRVADYSVMIAQKDGFSSEMVDLLRKSALLHDIGKIGIRDYVLLKDGKLNDDEFKQIKQHPVIGANILEQVNLPQDLQPLLPGVKYHHERYDGKGYPEGLSGDNIPLFGRLMAVADAFDAMTSDRPYRKGMSSEKALQIIEEGKGTQWDPYFAEVFLEVMGHKERISV
ncbi:HD-GYP domain-containing protein [Pontibacillus marinus]|uniref:Chemotaxis protein CheY n=1 Tax=Pontibacillus marinus BH030004 = DSM 16465 TaxID=1385511 RepID=A0A0A5FZI9_9BACI|nr:HD domain-containing phosphohydrolase [Pontibacillus marinus]KGX84253.1 hypothetical protein N783_17945 [Pontibacillus marinus BH030004 = DSM 16465]